MSDVPQGPGWWEASDGRWYPPTTAPGSIAPTPPPPAAYGGAPYAPPYGSVPGAPVYGRVPVRRTSGLAVASLICSIAGPVGGAITCGILAPASIVGVVLGHVALSQMKRDPDLDGRGMALAGVIVGWATIALGLLALIAVLALGDTSSSNDF